MTTATTLRILVPAVPGAALSPNASRYQHWGTTARARSALATAAWGAAYEVRPDTPLTGPLSVTVRVCWPRGRKRMDADNLTACLKSALDALTRAGIWGDDRQIEILDVRQERLDAVGNATWPGGVMVIDVEELQS